MEDIKHPNDLGKPQRLPMRIITASA